MLLALVLMLAQPPAQPAIRFLEPVRQKSVEPPAPAPDAPIKLSSDELDVIDSDVELFILQTKAGIVDISKPVAGPYTLRTRFAGGNGKLETKTFTGKFVYEIASKSTGSAELIIVPKGVQEQDKIVRRLIDSNTGSQPPPAPKPTPKPADEAPIKADGLHVLVVYESADLATYSASLQQSIYSKSVRDYLNSKCPKVGGTAEWRMWDKDVDATAESQLWQDALKRAKGKQTPWIIVSNGKTGFEGPLPAGGDEMLKLLQKYGE